MSEAGHSVAGDATGSVPQPRGGGVPAWDLHSSKVSWIKRVNSRALSLEAELERVPDSPPLTRTTTDLDAARVNLDAARHKHPECERAERRVQQYEEELKELQASELRSHRRNHDIAENAIEYARSLGGEHERRRWWALLPEWWTGRDFDEAGQALDTASQALLVIQDKDVVKSQLIDMTAEVATTLGAKDSRARDYLDTLQKLADDTQTLLPAGRAQLRAIRAVCQSSDLAAQRDARAYRNTLIELGALLFAVLAAVALLAVASASFRRLFLAAEKPFADPGGWFVLELEVVAALAGLTSSVLTLRNYVGFQRSYGLPFIQAVLKGCTGAATGLLGVLLVESGLVGNVDITTTGGVLATAIVFGSAQYLFTRLVDKQANEVLTNAGSRNDPAINPEVPADIKITGHIQTASDARKKFGEPGGADLG
jgi:hypothetical protein